MPSTALHLSDIDVDVESMLEVRKPTGAAAYQAPKYKPRSTKTTVHNNRTGITYDLFTDTNDQPTTRTLYVSNKGGTVKRSFALGMSGSMKLAGDPLQFRDEITVAGTATDRTGTVMYMTPADMGDLYHLWRPANDAGYIETDVAEERPQLPVTKWDTEPTPKEEQPKLEAVPVHVTPGTVIAPSRPDWLVEAQPLEEHDKWWETARIVSIIDLHTMQPVMYKSKQTGRMIYDIGKGRKFEFTHNIVKDGVLYGRLHARYSHDDASKVYAIRAQDPTTGAENLIPWEEPINKYNTQAIVKQWWKGFSAEARQTLADVIAPPKVK